MKPLTNPARRRRRVAVDAAMTLVILVLMVQMWLLTASLESYLAGHHGVAVPALVSSLILSGICGFLYRLVLHIDRLPDPDDSGSSPAMPGPWRLGRDVRRPPL